MSKTDYGKCLNCVLPASCCVGDPKKCFQRYEKYLAAKAKANKDKAQTAPKKLTLEGKK